MTCCCICNTITRGMILPDINGQGTFGLEVSSHVHCASVQAQASSSSAGLTLRVAGCGTFADEAIQIGSLEQLFHTLLANLQNGFSWTRRDEELLRKPPCYDCYFRNQGAISRGKATSAQSSIPCQPAQEPTYRHSCEKLCQAEGDTDSGGATTGCGAIGASCKGCDGGDDVTGGKGGSGRCEVSIGNGMTARGIGVGGGGKFSTRSVSIFVMFLQPCSPKPRTCDLKFAKCPHFSDAFSPRSITLQAMRERNRRKDRKKDRKKETEKERKRERERKREKRRNTGSGERQKRSF